MFSRRPRLATLLLVTSLLFVVGIAQPDASVTSITSATTSPPAATSQGTSQGLSQSSIEPTQQSAPQSATASTPHTTSSSVASSTAGPPSDAPRVHLVKAGAGGFVFEPDQLNNVSVGDVVTFEFYPPDHSVARAEFGSACVPYEYTGTGKVGFWSTTQWLDTGEVSLRDPASYVS